MYQPFRRQRTFLLHQINFSFGYGTAQEKGFQGFFVFEVRFLLAHGYPVKGGLSDEKVSPFNEFRHASEEKSEQEGPDVRSVHVGIGHDDGFVVA